MRRLSRPRLALSVAALALIGLFAAWQSGEANPIPPSIVVPAVGFGGFGGGGGAETLPEAPQVFIQSPVTEKSAQVWLRLQQPVSMPFANETPLEDVIKYVRSATSDEQEFPDGIPVYVDPAGLQEADKTMQSPIALNLDGLPLSYTLRLILKQLDLDYHVEPEGLLYITYIGANEPRDPMPRLLDEILAARGEIKQLRQDVAELKALLVSPPAQPARK